MAITADSRAERYLRYSHRGMVVVLVLTLLTGGLFLTVAVDPDGPIARRMPALSVLLPVAIALVAGALRATLRGDRWDPTAPEARMILQDEWRQANMSRALRAAFVVVLAAQVPLGLWLARLPTPRGTLAMATTSMTLGLATLAGLFLFLDREDGDGG